MTEKNEKRLTIRQQLRSKAEEKLVMVKGEVYEVIHSVCKQYQVKSSDLMKACGAGRHKTADHNLVTQLTNKAEADLVKLWNDQRDLPLEKTDAD